MACAVNFHHSTELRREALSLLIDFHTSSLPHVPTLSALGSQLSMTDKLPPPLLALFQPRPPLRYLPPGDRAPDDCQKSTISGVAQFLADAKTFADEVPYNATESWVQRKLRQKTEKKERLEKQIADGLQHFNPEKDPQARGDPFKTLFVARLSYEVKEADLEREFGRFGPIERITLVKDTVSEKKKKAHQGYAFIVYEREKDMKAAYKETDGIRIKDRRVLVDVERGRTTKGWKPRRFGGGLGGRGYTKAMPSRPGGPGFNAPSGPGGYGGGFRGGFGGRGGGGGFRGGSFRGGGDRGGGDRFGGPRGGIGYQGNRGGFGGQAPPTPPLALAVDAAEASEVASAVIVVVTAVVAPADSTVV
ncbi:Nucleotide-binding alpha-beta plait [Penicillium concentricum]|uniref:Nucleotide-binding alpha-beta plait n=1 Tax=Penicillium concentricum TaxID=293559 RepID=A0A9W9UTB1_9EURO|nr:Nucleotide-binding alpha-beta plait [Penicillium concentricum]KAJ5356577.1 Nucleotide-binding alpha-beta plait [Penicillium concentricum]